MGTLVGIMPLGCIAVLEGAMACETPCRGLLGELWIIPRSRRRLTAWSDMGWLLPQGDRFGGALDAAAKMFSKAFDSGIIPMEFVNKMKKEGKLIMGIGHRVKSVSCLSPSGPGSAGCGAQPGSWLPAGKSFADRCRH